jgi:hypothetical protein
MQVCWDQPPVAEPDTLYDAVLGLHGCPSSAHRCARGSRLQGYESSNSRPPAAVASQQLEAANRSCDRLQQSSKCGSLDVLQIRSIADQRLATSIGASCRWPAFRSKFVYNKKAAAGLQMCAVMQTHGSDNRRRCT